MKVLSRTANNLYYYFRRNSWMINIHRFFNNYEDIKVANPVFLLGNQGGGLTLVARMLRRHHQIVSITGNRRYWSGADEMQKVMMCRLPPSLRLGGRFVCRDHFHPIYTPPRSWSYASDDLIDYYRKTESDYSKNDEIIFRKIIFEALQRHSYQGSNKRFIDKSQVYSVKMSYINSLLKDTNPYFVLITRNPYAAVYRAALGNAGDMKRYSKFMNLDERIEVCAQHWCNAMQAVLEDSVMVEHFLHLRFEDVLQESKEMISKLCDFLDLAFSEELLPQQHHDIPFGSKYKDRWYPLKPDVNNPYLEMIPEKHIGVISERCGHIAEKFGYFPPNRKKFFS